MAGTKRRRGAAKASSGGSATSGNSSASNKKADTKKSTTGNIVWKVLQHVSEIATSPPRSEATLQAFADAKVSLEKLPSSNTDWDAYWMIVVTHVLNRLLQEDDGTSEQSKRLLIVAAMCDCMSRILTSDKTLLEKSIHIPASRSLLARAMLSATASALHCLKQTVVQEPGKHRTAVLFGATAALDRMVHLQDPGDDSLVVDWTSYDLESVCAEFAAIGSEEDCVTELEALQQSAVSISSSTGKKRSSRSTRRKSAAANTSTASTSSTSNINVVQQDTTGFAKALQTLVGEAASQRMDARNPVKRWASMAIVWYRKGPIQLLECIYILANQGGDPLQIIDSKSPVSELLRLLCRLLAIVAESGTSSGVRPPVGGMDHYIASLESSQLEVSSTTASVMDKNRADIRDWAVLASYDVLQIHKQVLQECPFAIVNDMDTPPPSADDMAAQKSEIFTAPSLATILSSLNRSAALSVANSAYSEQNDWTKAMSAITSAFTLQIATDPNAALDCRLFTSAISNLADTLRLLDHQAPSSSLTFGTDSSEREDSLERTFQLSKALPQPRIPGPAEEEDAAVDEMAFGISKKSTFAGMWTIRTEYTNEDALSLLMRALRASDKIEDLGNALIGFLMEITRRTYDTRIQTTTPKAAAITTTDNDSSLDTKPKAKGGRKRAVKSSTTGGRKTKQRKTTNEQTVGKEETEAKNDFQRISNHRALLARDSLTALRFCLTTQIIPGSGLARSIRNGLVSTQVQDFLQLGDMLDDVLVKTRLGPSTFSTPQTLETGGSQGAAIYQPAGAIVHSKEFTAVEKNLWANHMSVCQALGRGQTEYDGTIRYLFTEAERKIIVQNIPDGGRNAAWPLTLPAAHHAFLVANMTGTAVGPEHSSAEQHLVKQCIKSIGKTLFNLGDISALPKEQSCMFLHEGLLLSYQDARTLILAFSRLPPDYQRKSLEELIALVLPTLQKCQDSTKDLQALTANEESSSFVARVVVVISAMVSLVAYGRPLRQVLFAHVASGIRQLPGFYSSSEWYYCERCYMGLFGDWECPAVPELEPSTSPPNLILLKDKTIKELKSMLEVAFELGFETAQKDKCYLLFASWNGLGKLLTEGGEERIKLNDSTSLQINAEKYPRRILQLRDDISLIHNELNRPEGNRSMLPTKMRSNLKSTLHRANILLGRLLDNATEDGDEIDEVPMSLFSLLSALPTYVSASIAAHTKPGNDYFSSTLAKQGQRRTRRQRGYSSESERMQSDAESVETEGGGVFDDDVRVDAMSRLHECCDAFGAAPIHPDWLDVSCSFQEGIRASDAVDNAETALRMLNKLSRTAFEQYQKYLLKAIKTFSTREGRDDELLNVVLDLLPWNTHEPTYTSPLGPGSYSDDRDWKEDITTLFELPEGLLDLMMNDSVIKNVEAAKESWCPNAAHRLIGRLQDRKRPLGGWETTIPELRAGGEWEMLLAKSLTTACLQVKRYPKEAADYAVESDDDSDSRMGGASDLQLDTATMQNGHEVLRRAQIWRSILMVATNHMSPAAALLCMGINKVGRKPHPFSFHENSQDAYDVAPLSFAEQLGDTGCTSQLVRVTCHDTIALLSKLSTYGDDALSGVCHAIAAHLFVDTKSFVDLEALESIRVALAGLDSMLRLPKSMIVGSSSVKVVPYIFERLTLVLEDFSFIERETPSDDAIPEVERLRLFFGVSSHRTTDTVVGHSVKFLDILEGKSMDILSQGDRSTHGPSRDEIMQIMKNIVAVLLGPPLATNNRGRACAAVLLGELVASERAKNGQGPSQSPMILDSIIMAFNGASNSEMKRLVLEDLCCVGTQVSPYSAHKVELSHLLQYMMSSLDGEVKFEKARSVYDTLLGSFKSWPRSDHKQLLEPAFECLLSFGCRFDSLSDVSSKILALESKTDGAMETSSAVVDLELMTSFFAFIKHLNDAFSTNKQEQTEKGSVAKKEEEPSFRPKTIAPLGRRCSFVEKTGYHGQHWYNCYTCGLVWEKGCCTLCALVCHKGHDVSYSRYSSFFCDCAAEDGTAPSHNRVSCRCLMQLSEGEVKKLYDAERSFINVSEQRLEVSEKNVDAEEPKFPSLSVEIAYTEFSEETKLAISNLKKSSLADSWFTVLFGLLRKQFAAWKSAHSSATDILPIPSDEKQASIRPSQRVAPHSFRKLLRGRGGLPLDLKRLSSEALIPIRSAKGFQTRLSSDTSTNAHLIAKLSRHDITRSNIVSDSRGRLVVAEPCSLLFCSAVPAVATRYCGRVSEIPIARHQMCLLGSATVSFNIVGMRLCLENEHHLIVWGVSEASVAIVKPHWDGVETVIDLALDLDQNNNEADYIVKCDFMPGSQTNLVVGCGRYVRVFDISRSKDKRSNAVVAYNLGFEASLRDIALIPLNSMDGSESTGCRFPRSEQENVSKMLILLENGRLHSVDLKADQEGRIESPTDQPCELSGSVSLPTGGVRPRSGSSVGGAGSVAKSLGEGSRIFYLKQSRVLLYKCVSSCVLALLLDREGNVEGSFELIPHVISSDLLWNRIDGHSIVGPYHHWTELGIVYNDQGMFFRVACIGRSSRTNQPKILCVEFNEQEVKIKEIVWSTADSVGLSLSLLFEGLCAFSMPFIGDALKECRFFGERVYLCAATCTGSLLFFGEETVDTVATDKEDEVAPMSLVTLSGISPLHVKKPTFPLTTFEKLKNISDCEEVVFTGEGTGCDSAELKSRLLRDRSSSLVCHSRDGCTISISLRPKNRQKSNLLLDESTGKGLETTHAIVALRIMVGSTPGNVPSKIFVQGRPVDLTPRMKKWYSMPLTNEEIALGVRNGMIAVGIGPCFDSSNNSSVDSIEVYAIEREEAAAWIPKTYIKGITETAEEKEVACDLLNDIDIEDEATHGLLLSSKSLAHLSELCPQSAHPAATNERDFLRTLVEDTSFTKNKSLSNSVRSLLMKLEPDERMRSSLYDESILRGWSKAVLAASKRFDETLSIESYGGTCWDGVRTILRECLLSVTKIARERPMIYLQSMENLTENNLKGSLGTDMSRMCLLGATRQLPCLDLIGGPGGVIDLCLTEIAIDLNTERGKHLAKFDIVKNFLECSNSQVAEISCRAISSFCQRQGAPNLDSTDLFRLLQGTRLVAYKCDSCGICPMKEVRYTFLEEALDIDLCKECFTRGEHFARSNYSDGDAYVTIDERTVGAENKLTCAQLRQMQPVPLEKMDVEQVDVQSTARQSNTQPDAMDEDEELQQALRLSLGDSGTALGQGVEEPFETQAYEDFVSHLFTRTLDVLSGILKAGLRTTHLPPILRLALELIRNSTNCSSRNERARRYAREISQGISYLLNCRRSDISNAQDHVWSIISCIRSIQLLFLPEDDAVSFLEQLHADEDTKSKTHPNIVCEIHRIPAVRRRSAKGKNKDRRFYVCGRERGQRCNFFKWADDIESKPDSRIQVPSQLRDIVQVHLWNRTVSNEVPLNVILCELLEQELFDEDEQDDLDLGLSATLNPHEKKKVLNPISSMYGKEQLERDSIDGVFCSREKLLDTIAPGRNTTADGNKEFLLDLKDAGESKGLLLESCLDLLALVADFRTEGVTRWFSLLCEIEISANKSTEIRNLARKVLKTLCGKKRLMYYSIRDHFSFGFQLQALYKNASQLLEAARLIGEKARVCSPQWSATARMEWLNLPFGALIGADELISENECSQARLRRIGKVLDDVWAMVKNGGGSWRRFCGQPCLSPSHRTGNKQIASHFTIEQRLSEVPPVVALLWLACALSGTYQVKALRLIDAALSVGSGTAESNTDKSLSSSQTMEKEIVSTISGAEASAPEGLVLSGSRKLTVDDVAAFALGYILNGKNADLRRIGYQVISKILPQMTSIEKGELFEKCLASNFLHLGPMGKGSTDYLNFLQHLTEQVDSSISFEKHGDLVLDSLVNQINAMKNDRSNGEWVVVESSNGPSIKKKFDLSQCSYCIKTMPVATPKEVPKPQEGRDSNLSPRSSRSASQLSQGPKRGVVAKSASQATKKWHPEQVSPFARHRVDSLKLGSSSNEFCSFYALKHRVVVSDVILTVSDPRGRFVKNVAVYYSSRPVHSDASELKTEGYQWQKCATMTLPRGASRATASIAHPVTVANLKVEYTDFYERPGGSKASDGSLLVHCPRCTRVVTNAHGVCGNCGEVAFQCRKCRHINYDRLDAFLCVECGYCASGSFSVEITAAVASNAIAILSDKDCERATRILGAVNTFHEEIKSALTLLFRQIEESERSLSKKLEGDFNTEMSRALRGLPPVLESGKSNHVTYLDRLDKQGNVVKLAARPESQHGPGRTSAAGDRTRSLLRLARQIRSESGSAWDRRRSGDMIIRHLGRGIAVDNIDDERDLIGMLEDGDVLESSEPMGRSIGSARAGQRGSGSGHPALGARATGAAAGTSGAGGGASSHKKVSAQEMLDECQRLHMMMREAQREQYELKRRISAWQRLNEGALVDLGYPIQEEDMSTSCHCSVCGPTVSLHLLLLWSRLFVQRPSEVQVDRDFLSLLLSESATVGKTLSDCMREVVKDVATKSQVGAKFVLEEIRTRILATRDPVSAEILGKIMAVEGHFMAEEYSKLALELLAKGHG